jgi:biopolymer transport protein ExbD
MAMSTGSTGSIQSEINITPLVDVVLVLLIIFMVAQPMMQHGYDGAIPQPSPPPVEAPPGFILSLSADPANGALGEIRLNRELVPHVELAGRVAAEMRRLAPRDRVVFIDCDDRVNYNDLLNAVDELKRAGVTTVGFATTPLSVDT